MSREQAHLARVGIQMGALAALPLRGSQRLTCMRALVRW
jgi:hypothetical protein